MGVAESGRDLTGCFCFRVSHKVAVTCQSNAILTEIGGSAPKGASSLPASLSLSMWPSLCSLLTVLMARCFAFLESKWLERSRQKNAFCELASFRNLIQGLFCGILLVTKVNTDSLQEGLCKGVTAQRQGSWKTFWEAGYHNDHKRYHLGSIYYVLGFRWKWSHLILTTLLCSRLY